MSQAQQIGHELVTLCNQGKSADVVDRLYASTIVSIEDQASEQMPAQIEGIDALRAKHSWWNDNVEVHSAVAEGPFVGAAPNQFAVRFALDATMPGQPRTAMAEIAMYTVAAGKIVHEQFMPLAV